MYMPSSLAARVHVLVAPACLSKGKARKEEPTSCNTQAIHRAAGAAAAAAPLTRGLPCPCALRAALCHIYGIPPSG
eukprot:205206-Pelagomonas_calceolata.AAC.4